MQNVVNYLCPFFRNGTPIVNGRVYFVKPDTTAQTFTDIVALEGADFIAIKDKNGTLLENPLPLNSEGRFQTQPFVDDGIDFKMIVCYPTGEPAELHDESMTYDVAYTINSFAQQGEILSIGGVATVDSVAALRQLEPTVKAVLVRGFGAAGDFCPPRIFSWVQTVMSDDNGTKIRSSVTGYTASGTWVCRPVDFVDVRWFGVNPESGTDCTSAIIAIAQAYPNIPLYFPAGSYYISNHVTMNSAVLERLAIIYPTDDTTTDVKFTVSSHLENRGGRFDKNERECVVYPEVNGELRTSWLVSPMDTALNAANLVYVDEIIFDATKSVTAATVIKGKKVLVKNGVTVDDAINIDECSVFYEADGKLTAALAKLGVDWNIVPEKTDSVDQFDIRKGANTLFRFTQSLLASFAELVFGAGFSHSATDFWKVITDPNDTWYNNLVLAVSKGRFTELMANSVYASNANVTNAVVGSEVIQRMCAYDESHTAYVDIGANKVIILDYDGAQFPQLTITNGVVDLRQIIAELAARDPINQGRVDLIIPSMINVIVGSTGTNSHYDFIIPNNDALNVNVLFTSVNEKQVPGTGGGNVREYDYTNSAYGDTVKLLGCIDYNDVEFHHARFCLRHPSADERTRYNIAATTHWIIDPLTA